MHSITRATPSTEPFARVALPLPLANAFTYAIPDHLRDAVFVGCRVEVPFGKRVLSGIVVETLDQGDVPNIRPIRRVFETHLPLPLIRLTRWIASYYGCSFGEAAQSVLPPVLRPARKGERVTGVLELTAAGRDAAETGSALRRSRRQLELVQRLASSGGRAPVEAVTGEWGFSRAHLAGLVDKELAVLARAAAPSPLDALDAIEGAVSALTAEQERALGLVREGLAAERFAPILLHGVTGSGKTEVYLRAAGEVLSRGGGCIVLVPEIGLLPQATVRYRRMFGDDLAILHSRLTGAERFEMWRSLERGERRIVLGPRSAVFSPVRKLRLVVVDEEQDDSYKQDDKPRYHARAVALMRGKFENLTVLLGSATPSAESYNHARAGRYGLAALPTRVVGATLPEIRFVDMRQAPMQGAFFSADLVSRLEENLRLGHQSILFLNKRGHARFVQCNACGSVARCPNCDIALTFHRVGGRLRCHFCGFGRLAGDRCGACGSPKLYFGGVGTQRVELDLAGLFPGVWILRMDADTTSGKRGHERVLGRFGSGDYPILIGTQMVAKGHHFPNVGLVGILFAEESLHYPDFRSGERTFQQLTQVAGRAGRGSRPGEVVIQTYIPEHPVFKHLASYDYDGFMDEELEIRKQLRYPPYSKIVLAQCSAAKNETVHRVIARWAHAAQPVLRDAGAELLGPAPPIVPRLRNRYREQVLIKGHLSDAVKGSLLESFARIADREPGGRSVDLRWDVDPESFV